MHRGFLFLLCASVLMSSHCDNKHRMPEGVICAPCSEAGPPAGYDCAGQIMVKKSTKNKDIPKLQRECAKLKSQT